MPGVQAEAQCGGMATSTTLLRGHAADAIAVVRQDVQSRHHGRCECRLHRHELGGHLTGEAQR